MKYEYSYPGYPSDKIWKSWLNDWFDQTMLVASLTGNSSLIQPSKILLYACLN